MDEYLLVCIDIQERLLPVISKKEKITKNANILLSASGILDIDVFVSKQYVKGLGEFHKDINLKDAKVVKTIEKTSFSAFEQLSEFLLDSKYKNLVFFGIETHICVYQTIKDAKKHGLRCTLIEDASSSRDENNHNIAVRALESKNVEVLSTEQFLFGLLKDAKHPNFKDISKLIK
ncbi:hypothetical protein BKH43_00800 [Helicobacter sp. 13S00401-1]|uniref:isochorismatase family protein n=1 Tax=Helicobacter sp. 13S00401-1 TaxID=1905758 RepID=UPI000BA5C5A9|nr:isochorismatase family protein [Helicobacter sp. 13S00401-1]PAF51805.1 hypothetical protein BKH43_00800 [Helicobacter sp. 13S00401-1]